MSLNHLKYKAKTREQEILIAIYETQVASLGAIGALALEVTADQINLNTDTLETSNDAIQLSNAAIKTAAESLNSKIVPTVRTNNVVVATGSSSVPAGAITGSCFNGGAANGTWAGQTIPPGVSIPLPLCHQGDTYGEIFYNGTGTTLYIQYTS
jgi:hypothetical protein